MDTITVDDYMRVRIPDAKPGQVFGFTNNGDGTRTLTELKKAEPRQMTAKLVRKNGRLFFEIPEGLELADGPIERVVPK